MLELSQRVTSDLIFLGDDSMTAQVPDGYMYEGKEYSIIAMSKNINFNIEDFGIQPEYTCTACWRGFAIDYSIEYAKLLLKTIWVSQSGSGYPDVNGVKVKKLEKRGIFSYVYENVNMPIKYTGKIVIGCGFIDKYYIHMGFQEAWAYETVLELIFKKGVLLDVIDHSDRVRKIREDIESGKSDTKEVNILSSIHKSFSLNIEDKAWWLNE